MSNVRVATYNLYVGADLSLLFDVSDLAGLAEQVQVVRRQLEATRFSERATALAALLARERPHLVGLQEVSRWTVAPIAADGSLGDEQVLVDFLPVLLEALDEAGCPFDAHVVNENFAGAMPVSDSEWMSLVGANVTLVRRDAGVAVLDGATGEFTAGHEVVTGIDGVAFPVVRSWGSVDVRSDDTTFRFVNTHTEAYDAGVRDAQRDELIAVCGEAATPVVLVGDFNATPDEVGVPEPWVDAWSQSERDGGRDRRDGRAGCRPREREEQAACAHRLRVRARRPRVGVPPLRPRSRRPERAAPAVAVRPRRRRRRPRHLISVRRATPQLLGHAAPLLACESALLRPPGGPGRPALRRRWRTGLVEQIRHPGTGGLPVAMLRAVLRRRHRQHAVDEPVLESLQQPITHPLGQHR